MKEFILEKGIKKMIQVLKNLSQHFFKVYFFLTILGFTLLILIMNLASLWAFDKDTSDLNSVDRTLQAEEEEGSAIFLPKKFYQWNFTNPKSGKGIEQGYMEFRGNRMYLKVRF